MSNEISNTDNVIDSRDVIARIGELESEQADLAQRIEDGEETQASMDMWDDENLGELVALQKLAEQAEGYASDWQYGATLIRDSYFTDYARELLEDCGDLPKDLPSYIAIDWEQTAQNIQSDYTAVDFDGETYWIR